MTLLSLPRLLVVHQSLLALTIFLAAHQTPISEVGRAIPDWLTAAVALLNAGVWLLVTRRRVGTDWLGPLRRASPLLWIPAAYFLLVSIFSVARGEIAPAAWLSGLATYGLTFWTAAQIFGAARDARLGFAALTVAGLAFCTEAFLLLGMRGDPRVLLLHGPFWSGYGGINAPAILGFAVMDSNTLASFLIVFSSLALGLWACAETPRARMFAVIAVFVFTACLLMTGSRGGLPFFVILLLAWAGRRGKWKQAAAAGGAAALFGGILLLLTRQTGGLLRGDGNLKARFHMARVSLHVARRHPIFGGGPDAFGQEWRVYGPAYGYGNSVTQPDGLLWSLLAEGGLLMAAMAVILIVGLTREIRRALKQPGRAAPRELLLALSLGLAAALGHDALETAFRSPALALFVCLLAGLTLGTSARQGRRVEHIGKGDA